MCFGMLGKGEPKDAIEHLQHKLRSLETDIEDKKKDLLANNPSSTWLLMFRYNWTFYINFFVDPYRTLK